MRENSSSNMIFDWAKSWPRHSCLALSGCTLSASVTACVTLNRKRIVVELQGKIKSHLPLKNMLMAESGHTEANYTCSCIFPRWKSIVFGIYLTENTLNVRGKKWKTHSVVKVVHLNTNKCLCFISIQMKPLARSYTVNSKFALNV